MYLLFPAIYILSTLTLIPKGILGFADIDGPTSIYISGWYWSYVSMRISIDDHL